MAQAAYEVQVRIERDTPTTTDSGGETLSESTVASGLYPTKHFHSAARFQREEGNFSLSGPGLQTVSEVFFKFTPPFPAIVVNDRIVEIVSGLEWQVKFVRAYARTMQVDVDRVS